MECLNEDPAARPTFDNIGLFERLDDFLLCSLLIIVKVIIWLVLKFVLPQ